MTFLAMLPGLALVSEWLGGGWMVEYDHTPVSWPQLNGLAEFLSLRWSVVTAATQQVGASQQQKLQDLLEAVTQNFCPPHHVISTMYYWSKPIKIHIQGMDK